MSEETHEATRTTKAAMVAWFVGGAALVAVAVIAAFVIGRATSSLSTGHAGMDAAGGHHMADGSAMGGGAMANLGVPADVADADRTIAIVAADDLTFTPAEIQVEVGETIAFEITNEGQVDHEFFLADETMQVRHEDEMGGSPHPMGDTPHAVSLEPGETKTIAWTFTEAGTIQFGCHLPGHFEGGMVGTITVS